MYYVYVCGRSFVCCRFVLFVALLFRCGDFLLLCILYVLVTVCCCVCKGFEGALFCALVDV